MFNNKSTRNHPETTNPGRRRGIKLTALTVAGALAMSLAAFAPAADAATANVTFKGHVYSPTHKGVANVQVTVYYRIQSVGQYFTKKAKTSATGRYEFKVPKSSDYYKLKVTAPGDDDRDTADGKWAPVLLPTFTTNATTIKKNVTVQPGAKISGRIYDRTGKPVKTGLVVRAFGSSQIGNPITYTRAGGAYYFSNLNTGSVNIQADSPTTNGSARLYVSTSSSGTLNFDEATAVSVKPGLKATGKSIYFPTVSKITGRVTVDGTEPFGEGQRYVSTVLYNSRGERLYEDGYFTNPTFQFRDLPAGTYYLGFESGTNADPIVPEFYKDKTTLADATPIRVSSGGAVTGIVANLASAPVVPAG